MLNYDSGLQMVQIGPSEIPALKEFLESQGLLYENDIEYSVALMDNDTIIATGSFCGSLLKCIAVAPSYQGLDICAKIVSELVKEEHARARNKLFLFTKPQNQQIFTDLGFTAIASADMAILMENSRNGIDAYLKTLAPHSQNEANVGAVVVNCNPFTKGHRFLIEYAASRCNILHVFVVWEDRSVFPSEVREYLVKEGTKDIGNVRVHRAKDYIISSSTFPSYFLKDSSQVARQYARIDLDLFCRHIAPYLNIKKRFVGQEKSCATTAIYNEEMKIILPKRGIEVQEIERIDNGETIISASIVRGLLKKGCIEKVRTMVPDITYNFLISKDGQEIIEKLRR